MSTGTWVRPLSRLGWHRCSYRGVGMSSFTTHQGGARGNWGFQARNLPDGAASLAAVRANALVDGTFYGAHGAGPVFHRIPFQRGSEAVLAPVREKSEV